MPSEQKGIEPLSVSIHPPVSSSAERIENTGEHST